MHVSLSLEATAVLLVLPVAALVGWLARDLLHDRATTRAGAAAEHVGEDAAEHVGSTSGDAAEVSPVDPPAPPPLPSA